MYLYIIIDVKASKSNIILFVYCVNVWVSASMHTLNFLSVHAQLLFYTNHADIKDQWGQTAAYVARREGYRALARDVEAIQPGPRGELVISCWTYHNNYCSLSTF